MAHPNMNQGPWTGRNNAKPGQTAQASRAREQSAMRGHFEALIGLLDEHKSSLVDCFTETDATGERFMKRYTASDTLAKELESRKKGRTMHCALQPDELQKQLRDLGEWMNQNPQCTSIHGPLHERFAATLARAEKFEFFDKLATYTAADVFAAGRTD